MAATATTGKKKTFVAATLRDVKGTLYWNRTWDYESAATIGAVKMYLPNCKVEFFGAFRKSSPAAARGVAFTAQDGSFEFRRVPTRNAFLRVHLEHKDAKVTKFVGFKNVSATADLSVQRDQTIWGKVALDGSKLKGPELVINLGEVEIANDEFKSICDAYHTIVFGHRRMIELVGEDLPFVETRYPQDGTTSYYSAKKMWITPQRARRRATLLHEYAHYIIDHKLGGYATRGYGYNDDATESHGPTSKEYLDAAWNEGIATFLGQAMADTPKYHSSFGMDLDTDRTAIGGHNEASVQGALWHAYKRHGASIRDIWDALTDKSRITVRTAWDFWDSWKYRSPTKVETLRKAYEAHGMLYRYIFLAKKYKAIAAPGAIMALLGRGTGPAEFVKVWDLFQALGKVGAGTEIEYKEEFYNENKYSNAGALAAGSSAVDPKTTEGKEYLVPERKANT